MTTTNDNPWLEADDTNDVSQVEPRTQPVRLVETPMAKATETVKEAPSPKKEPKAKPAVESPAIPASSTPSNNNVRNSILVLSGVLVVAVGLMMFRANETPAPTPAKTQNATVIKEAPAPQVEAPSVPAPVADEPAPAPAPQVEAPTNSPLDKETPKEPAKEPAKDVKTDTVQLPPPPPLPTLAKPVESGVASAKEAKDTKPRLVHLKSQPIVNKPDGWDEAERKMQEFAARQQALNPAR